MDQAERDRMELALTKRGEIKATPVKRKEALAVSDILKRVHNFASEPFGYKNPPGQMISEALGIPAISRTLERFAYGEPQFTGAGGLGGTSRPRADLVDSAMAVAPLAQVTRGLPVGAATRAVREQNLQKFLAPSAEQGRWYHGTSTDVKEFNPALGLERPGQAGASFVSQNPAFSSSFANDAQQYAAARYKEHLTPEQIAAASKKAENYFRAAYPKNPKHRNEMIASLKSGNPEGEALDELMKASAEFLPAGPNVMPLHVRVEKPFDPAVAAHLEELRALNPNLPFDEIGRTSVLERPEVQEAIKRAGFDSFYTTEGGTRNLGIFDPRRIKSAIGNRGTYDINETDITKKKGGLVHLAGGGSISIPSDFTTPDMSDSGGFFPDPDYMSLALQNSR